jgi:N-acetyl-anhydromuramyl-L-alanine amidase AmpD
MTTRRKLAPRFVLSAVALAGLALAPGCRPHTAATSDDWASVVRLDGDRNDVLSRVADETGVPPQVLYAIAYQQGRFEGPDLLADDEMDAPIAITDDPELADAVEPTDVIDDDVSTPEGLEDVQEEIDMDPEANAWSLDEEADAEDPEVDPSEPAQTDTGLEIVGEEHPDDGGTVSMFYLTPDQVAWAATELGVDAGDIDEDLELAARATAALLLGDLATSGTRAADASHERWEEAMVRFVGLDPMDDAGTLAQSDFHEILTLGLDAITEDGEELMMIAAAGATIPDFRTPGDETDLESTGGASETSAGGDVTIESLAGDYPETQWIPASSSNYTSGRGYQIRYVVIHDIEGTMPGAISVFRSSGSQASAHYIVRSRDGHIVQMVRERDSAWHSGNWIMNHSSIGIEHEGFADRPHGGGYYNTALYESSAQLTCAIAQRYHIPVDRRHIFGHGNVSTDSHSTHLCSDAQANRGECGGASHHHDPGRYWDWNLYMNLVARCVSGHPHTTPTRHATTPHTRSAHEQEAITTGWAGQRALVDASGNLRMFATDSAHRVVEYVRTDGHWGNYRVIGREARSYPAAIVSGGHVVVAYQDTDDHVRVLRFESGAWTTTVLPDLTTDAMPSLFENEGGRVEVFVRRAPEHVLSHIAETTPGGDFGHWRDLGGHLRTMPTVIADAEGRPHVFAIGDADGHVWTRVRTAPNEWASWTFLTITGNAPVSPVRLPGGNLGVFTRTHTGALVSQISDPSGTWSHHPHTVGGIFTSPVVAVLDSRGRVNVFGRGQDSAVYRIVRNAEGRWGTHARLGGRAIMGPAAVLAGDRLEIFIAGQNHGLFGAFQSHDARSGWSGWHGHGGRLRAEGRASSGVYAGITLDGSHIPHEGLANPTLRATLGVSTEPYGTVTDYHGQSWVSGRVSWFGGPTDTGIPTTGRMAISGELARLDNSPMHPSSGTLAAHLPSYYYCAMRWDYHPNDQSFWRDARIVVTNPRTGVQVVVRAADWGPNTFTHRIIDLSPQAIADLHMATDDTALVAFAPPGTPLGPVH